MLRRRDSNSANHWPALVRLVIEFS